MNEVKTENAMNDQLLAKESKRKHEVHIIFSEEQYALIKENADKAHLRMAPYCRKLILDGRYRLEVRTPMEMEKLEDISKKMSEILDAEMEILRQLRYSGQLNETVEHQITESVACMGAIRDELLK